MISNEVENPGWWDEYQTKILGFDKKEDKQLKRVAIAESDFALPISREDGTIDPFLFDIISTPTPHGHEKRIHKYLSFLNSSKLKVDIDSLGNIIVRVGTKGKDFDTIFSCHMDTAHGAVDAEKIYKLIVTSYKNVKENVRKANEHIQEGMVYALEPILDKKTKEISFVSGTLGADDKLGVYILNEMILAGIPGQYMFHVGEERGCIGARHILEKTPEWIKGFKRAIAFDRMNYGDVIAHQRGSRCASIEATEFIADKLNETMPPLQQFKGDVHGLYTDVAVYADIIPECVNLSVGYFNQHGSSEHFDSVWLKDILLPTIKRIAWEEIPTKRVIVPRTVYNYGRTANTNKYPNSTWSNKKVKWSDISADTSIWELPDWDITSGYIIQCKPEGMERLIKNWLLSVNDYSQTHPAYGLSSSKKLLTLLAREYNQAVELKSLRRLALLGKTDTITPILQKIELMTAVIKCFRGMDVRGLFIPSGDIDPGTILTVRTKVKKACELIEQAEDTIADVRSDLEHPDRYQKQLNMKFMMLIYELYPFREAGKRLRNNLEAMIEYVLKHPQEPIFVGVIKRLTILRDMAKDDQ